MSLLNRDGSIEIYIIRHVHPNVIAKGWDGHTWSHSGDCSQFEKSRGFNRAAMSPLTSSGTVWQDYGIHGTFLRDEAVTAANEMAKAYPDYHWSVACVRISQLTIPIAILHSNAPGMAG